MSPRDHRPMLSIFVRKTRSRAAWRSRGTASEGTASCLKVASVRARVLLEMHSTQFEASVPFTFETPHLLLL